MMTQSYITEYYRLNDKPVALLMTPERIALQAWYVNYETRRFERGGNSLLIEITDGEHQGRMNQDECVSFCKKNNIDPTINPKNLSLSWRLAEQNRRRIEVPQFHNWDSPAPLALVQHPV